MKKSDILFTSSFNVNRRRFLSAVIDRMIIIFIFMFYLSYIEHKYVLYSFENYNVYITLRFVVIGLVFFLYFFLQELFLNKTISKAILGIIVISSNDEELNFKRIFLRSICRFAPIDIFLLGSPEGCIDDRVAKTSVVKDEDKMSTFYSENDSLIFTLLSRKKMFWSYLLDRLIICFWSVVLIATIDFFIENKNVDLTLINGLIFCTVYFLYFYVQELSINTTIAKKTVKSYLVNQQGDKPSSNQILIRNLCRFIPFDTLSYIFCRLGFHDKISKTFLVTKVKKKA